MKHSEKYLQEVYNSGGNVFGNPWDEAKIKRYGDYRRSEGMMALWELQKNEKAVASVMETLELMAKEDNI